MIEQMINRIIHADCMDILRALPDKCVDLVLTDPPYGDGQGGGSLRVGGNRFEKYENGKALSRIGGTWAAKYGKKASEWDKAPDEDVFREIFRVSKNQIIWGGNYFNLPPTRCFNVWKKLTISEGFSMAMAEYAWCSFNENAKIYECAPQDSNRFHPTQKPISLIMWQLEKYSNPGDLILDPFSGSGTTAIAAHRLGRRFVCIEKDADYHAASVARLAEEKKQQRLDFSAAIPKAEQLNLFDGKGN